MHRAWGLVVALWNMAFPRIMWTARGIGRLAVASWNTAFPWVVWAVSLAWITSEEVRGAARTLLLIGCGILAVNILLWVVVGFADFSIPLPFQIGGFEIRMPVGPLVAGIASVLSVVAVFLLRNTITRRARVQLLIVNVVLWAIAGVVDLGQAPLSIQAYRVFVPFGFLVTLISIASGGVILFMIRMFRRGIYTVGNEMPPEIVLQVRFGRPVRAVEVDVHFAWPWDVLVRFLTTPFQVPYDIPNVYSKGGKSEEGEEYATQNMKVSVNFAFSWPRPSVQIDHEDCGTRDKNRHKDPDGKHKYRRSAKELLSQVRHALPFDTREVHWEDLSPFLMGSIADAVTNVMADYNHRQCREEREEIEEAIKDYLLRETGNLVFELGIPWVHIDFQITSIVIPEQTEEVLRQTEVVLHEGKQGVLRAEAQAQQTKIGAEAQAVQTKIGAEVEAEVASVKAEVLTKLIEAHVARDVAPDMAAILVSGGFGEEGMSFRDYALTQGFASVMQALGGGSQKDAPLNLDTMLDWVEKLTPSHREIIEGFFRNTRALKEGSEEE